jgi:YVTN family beta-propeller protein
MKHLKALSVRLGVLVLLGSAWSARADVCAYVANSGSDYISVIDVATNTVAAEVGVQGSPRAVAVDPGGQFIYSVVDGRVSVVDAMTFE